VVDAVSVHRPALWFITMLREELARSGVVVRGKTRTLNWLDREIQPLRTNGLVELGSVSSPLLPEILTRMMKPSQNLYAHLLLLQTGARAAKALRRGESTEDAGLAEMRRFLETAGVPPDEVLLEEGSGLSRGALVTPNATVALLQHMSKHRWKQEFRNALPIAGVDGTLRNRMKGTAAAKNARAKTGTLRYVNTLSGYVTTQAGEELVFSLMLNNYEGEGARSALDWIVVTLADWPSQL
jgi:serine-type D-Ala-D-Ala carboxypeptidase/endopeptidase (penicillin-binding protein 4)